MAGNRVLIMSVGCRRKLGAQTGFEVNHRDIVGILLVTALKMYQTAWASLHPNDF